MKKIIRPSEQEESVYYSDFTGKILNTLDVSSPPPVELKVDFNYGSKYDGIQINLHLNDEDAEELIKFLKSKINPDVKDFHERFK